MVFFESEIQLEPGEFNAIHFDVKVGLDVLIVARELREDDFDLYVVRDEDVIEDDFCTTHSIEICEYEYHYQKTIRFKETSTMCVIISNYRARSVQRTVYVKIEALNSQSNH
jgi:hypothetical protein